MRGPLSLVPRASCLVPPVFVPRVTRVQPQTRRNPDGGFSHCHHLGIELRYRVEYSDDHLAASPHFGGT